MKITNTEAKKICADFSLGEFKSIKPIKGGLSNFNFSLKTSKGEFVVRGIGQKITPNKKERLTTEFNVMEFLTKKKFPYFVPLPIKNIEGKRLHQINNKDFWVYEKIPGKSIIKFSGQRESRQVRELAKALATYHKYVGRFQTKESGFQNYLKWVLEITEAINPKKPIDKTDKLALKEKEFFKEIILQGIKQNYSKNILPLHSDLDPSNVLFKGDKIIAIIDFDDLEYGPRARDVAISIRDTCTIKNKLDKERVKTFLKEYEKINSLTKDEKEVIPFLMLVENAGFFSWVYGSMKKEKQNRYKYMLEMSRLSYNIIKDYLRRK